MSYLVKLQQFEGPLDLLLHLISKSKVQIEEISIAEITEQYLDTLQMMDQFDIEVASEFLVMAATLLHIKSCMLVPKVKQEPELSLEDESDPRQELITRLLEYKKYKEAGVRLRERESCFSNMFFKLPEERLQADNKEVFPADLDIRMLQDALYELLHSRRSSIRERQPMVHEIKRDPITIKEKVSSLKKYFSSRFQTTFFEMFQNQFDREEIIVTFLALLELLKDNFIDVSQAYPFGDIVIKRRTYNG
jgi:segregation and condensation protein A